MPLTRSRIRREGPLPRHYQVRQILADLVTQGEWAPGHKIPAETDIAEALGVSKMTVNKAILALTAAGVFYREVGRGTFVATVQEPARGISDRRAPETMRREGVKSAATLHVVTVGPAEMVADNEYVCSLLLALRCHISPLEAALPLRQARGEDYVACWNEEGSDGWILIAPMQEDVPGLRALAAAGARAVMVGASWPDVALPCVDSDNVGGAHVAVAHLEQLGHRQIAMLYADPNAINTQDRIEGFTAAMRERGLPLPAGWALDSGDSIGIVEPVRERLRDWLRRSDRPTAFLAAGAFLACSLLEIAREVGLRVPEDLSIVGFDDPAALSDSSPALTTVRQPIEEMGRAAVTCLNRRLHDPQAVGEAERLILPCRLLVRESTAPPRTHVEK